MPRPNAGILPRSNPLEPLSAPRGERARKPLGAAALALALASIMAASILSALSPAAPAFADPFDEMASQLSDPAPGKTVTLKPGDIDLAGRRIDVGGPGATLEGSPGAGDYEEIVAGAVAEFLARPDAEPLAWADAEKFFGELAQRLLSSTPKTRIHNSQAKAVTSEQASRGLHSGISAPKGGFSLKNLSFSGTAAKAVRADAATGATHVYMGLAGPDLSRLAKEDGAYAGMGDISQVAFVGNSAEADSNVNVEGNTVFFTQRRYGPSGEFDQKKQVNALAGLNSVTASLFHENKTVVAPPAASGDTGNRTYSGAGLGWARVGLIDATVFSRNSSFGGHHAFGGALFADKISRLSRSVFAGNSVTSDHDAFGGAAAAKIGVMTGCVLVANQAEAVTSSLVPGAAAAGGALSGSVLVIEGSHFAFNSAISNVADGADEKEALGGAVSTNQTYLVSGSKFFENSATASAPGGLALGGALCVAASTDGANPRSPRLNLTVIRNSSFISNRALAPAGKAAGGALAVLLSGSDSYRLVLTAEYGQRAVFQGNFAGSSENSLAFLGGAAKGASLVIRADQGGAVDLLDPLSAELGEGGDFSIIREGPGDFTWGGANEIMVAENAKASVDLGKQGLVVLTESFSLAPRPGAPNIEVALSGASIHLEIGDGRARPFFSHCDFSSFEGGFTAEFTKEEMSEAAFFLASDSTGLKPFSASWPDPKSGSTYSLDIDSAGKATLRRSNS